MSATARTTIYVGFHNEAEVETAKTFIKAACAQTGLDNYTIYDAEGVWKGGTELAVIIEVIGDSDSDDFLINELAHRLRYHEAFGQEAVYIVRELVDLVVV